MLCFMEDFASAPALALTPTDALVAAVTTRCVRVRYVCLSAEHCDAPINVTACVQRESNSQSPDPRAAGLLHRRV